MTPSAPPVGPVIVSCLIVVAFVSSISCLMTLNIDFKATSGQAILVMLGVLSNGFAQVCNYWLGSSAGSAAKSAQIAAMVGKVGP